MTILALARWLKPDEPPTSDFVTNRLTEDYNPLVCPVNGRVVPPTGSDYLRRAPPAACMSRSFCPECACPLKPCAKVLRTRPIVSLDGGCTK